MQVSRPLARFIGASALIAAMASTLVVASPTFAVTQPQVSAIIGGCFYGKASSDDHVVHVIWRDRHGHLKGHFTESSSEYGDWSAPADMCAHKSVAIGDQFSETDLDSGLTTVFRVSPMSFTFSRQSGKIVGSAPPSGAPSHGHLYLSVAQQELATGDSVLACQVELSSSTKHYSYDTANCDSAGYHVTGGDYAYVDRRDPKGNEERLTVRAPFVQAELGRAKVEGALTPSSAQTLTLRHANGTSAGSAHIKASGLGDFSGAFRKAGSLVPTKAGDTIAGNWAGPWTYRVAPLALAVKRSASRVHGTCTAHTRYGLFVKWTTNYAYLDGVTDGRGLTGTINTLSGGGHHLGSGDQVSLVCMRPSGDRTRLATTLN
jgi:hypothetical protein